MLYVRRPHSGIIQVTSPVQYLKLVYVINTICNVCIFHTIYRGAAKLLFSSKEENFSQYCTHHTALNLDQRDQLNVQVRKWASSFRWTIKFVK